MTIVNRFENKGKREREKNESFDWSNNIDFRYDHVFPKLFLNFKIFKNRKLSCTII